MSHKYANLLHLYVETGLSDFRSGCIEYQEHIESKNTSIEIKSFMNPRKCTNGEKLYVRYCKDGREKREMM